MYLALALITLINMEKVDHAAQSNENFNSSMGGSSRAEMGKSFTPGPGQYYKYENQNYKFAYTK